jgi:spore coat protein A, manganese oxidase
VTTQRKEFVAVRLLGAATTLSVISLLLFFLGTARGSYASSLVQQKALDGTCVPKFAVSLPVFGPAGSVPRVDAASHPSLTVTMNEIDQAVLPQGFAASCGTNGVTLGKTRVWAFKTQDTNTGRVLGPANWPAVTIVARRGTATRVKYVNHLPSFDPSNPTGPGLVQGVLPFDQTIHWADPLQSGCGMNQMGLQSAPVLGHDKLMDFAGSKPSYCGGKAPCQPAIRLASYSTASSTAHSMPSPMGSSMTSHMGSSMQSNMGSSTASNADPTLPCNQQYIGPIPATVHLHGGEIPAAFDGDPNSWFTPNGLKGSDYHTIGNPGPGKAIYEYPNLQEPGTLWFHDHALGITRLNVYAGLAGFYFLKDPSREPKGYPSGPYEIEMAVQDRTFDTNSQLYFAPQQAALGHPFWSVVFEGDVATVNGAAFPYLNVEPRRYRFHLLNGSNHRGYRFVFGSAPVYLVGSDDNYFDKPVPVPLNSDGTSQGVRVSPGERADVIVDFSDFAGQNITLQNMAGFVAVPLPEIMQFRVASAPKRPDTSCDPDKPIKNIGVCGRKYPLVRLTDGNGNVLPGVKVDKIRQMVFYDYVVNGDPPDIKEFVNNTEWNGLESPSIAYDFPTDGVSELPRVGSVEMWEIAYPSAMMGSHPVHIHLSQFQVLSRQNINSSKYLNDWNSAFGTGPAPLPSVCKNNQYCLNYGPPKDYLTPNTDGALGGNLAFKSYLEGNVMPPEPEESGWKDTADLSAGQVIRILVRWTPSDIPNIRNHSWAGKSFYEFDPTQGSYVWHCHLLNHEDNEMMRPYRVTW